jgi:hypothetical protein
LETAIADLKNKIESLSTNIVLLKNENTGLNQQTAEQQAKINQDQVVIQIDQERMERLEKLLVLERAKTEDLKTKVASQTPTGPNAN